MNRAQPVILLAGGSEDSPDLFYASGFRTSGAAIFVQRGADEKHLVVPAMEYGRAAREAAGATVYTPDMLGLRKKRNRRVSDWAIGLLRKLQASRATVPGFFPLALARRVEAAGIRLHVATSELFPARQQKRPDEIRKISGAQQAAVIAMRAAVRAIGSAEIDPAGNLKSGGRHLTAEAVKQIITRSLLDHRCFCRELIVAGGRQGVDPHERGHGPLRAHEPIVMDIFPQHMEHGYWGDLTRTVLRGTASPVLRRMYNAVRAAHAAALARVKPGIGCATIHRAAADAMTRRGFKTTMDRETATGFIHSTGHGVGLAVHEAPAVWLNDTRLKAGNVITIEPGLYYPTLGGIRIEDTVVVTPTGWRYLAPCEKRFEV